MWIKHEKRFRSCNYIRIVIVMMVLVKACDACSRRRNPSPQRPPPTQPPKTKKTTSGVGTMTVQITPSKSSTFSAAIPSANTSNTSQVENYTICYTTSVQNLTEMKIALKIEVLKDSGNLSVIFNNVEKEKRNVFLKWLQSNTTTCSNVQGYFISIERDQFLYSYNITLLNQTSATEHCEQARNCSDLGGLTTMTSKPTSKPTEQLNTTVPSFHQTEGNNPTNTKEMTDSHTNEPAAGRSEDSEVSTTTVVGISVAVVVLLVIVVVIIALWYKRKCVRKGYGEDKMRGSVDHLAGPINGDVYTVVNPNAEKTGKGKSESNDMVYIELSHQKSGKSADKVCKVPSSQQENYADISHILTPGESTYENATPKCDQDYANVVALQ
ncbi:uncharacterized protein LOC114525298 [Dendronephthya gigantea]|uniref:uncharacterized protein LOC114525298 n=1 Tax=Dendronephthya gigantea TaxID=151771 RepID=UPI00106C143C|nr:uncharacterized protein LOC114525298 [Dendronephthya gigantea]